MSIRRYGQGGKHMTKNIMIAGVGGQGTLLTSRILGAALIAQGYDVKVSEVHGMSQRGGSVITYVRYGEEVFSPVIEEGQADVILAFEELEAARVLTYLNKEGKLLVNMQKLDPMPVITGAAEYPDDLIGQISQSVCVMPVNALQLAEQAGSSKCVNVVMIGRLAQELEIPYDTWIQALRQTVPEEFLELNLRAFELGFRQE